MRRTARPDLGGAALLAILLFAGFWYSASVLAVSLGRPDITRCYLFGTSGSGSEGTLGSSSSSSSQ